MCITTLTSHVGSPNIITSFVENVVEVSNPNDIKPSNKKLKVQTLYYISNLWQNFILFLVQMFDEKNVLLKSMEVQISRFINEV
jgi:hypothetical protein